MRRCVVVLSVVSLLWGFPGQPTIAFADNGNDNGGKGQRGDQGEDADRGEDWARTNTARTYNSGRARSILSIN